jgi:hypothetical protein
MVLPVSSGVTTATPMMKRALEVISGNDRRLNHHSRARSLVLIVIAAVGAWLRFVGPASNLGLTPRTVHKTMVHAQAEQEHHWQLSTKERTEIARLSRDLSAIWKAGTTTNQDRKRLLRMAIESGQLDGVSVSGQIEVQIRWHSGTGTRLTVKRPVIGSWSLKTPQEAVAKIHSLAEKHSYSYHEIAEKLNREGVRTAFGRSFIFLEGC